MSTYYLEEEFCEVRAGWCSVLCSKPLIEGPAMNEKWFQAMQIDTL